MGNVRAKVLISNINSVDGDVIHGCNLLIEKPTGPITIGISFGFSQGVVKLHNFIVKEFVAYDVVILVFNTIFKHGLLVEG